ncbi:MAG: hypothetical protein V4631_15620 [Pseudomonadota bacterium]
MKTLTKFVCMILAAAAVSPSLAAAVEVPQVALFTACPDVVAALPESLYPAWRAIDSAAVVKVDFKLDGGKVRAVNMSGGHGDYIGHVRRAVRAMKCRQQGDGIVAVRFSIRFQYPEDLNAPAATLQLIDETPSLAMLQTR